MPDDNALVGDEGEAYRTIDYESESHTRQGVDTLIMAASNM